MKSCLPTLCLAVKLSKMNMMSANLWHTSLPSIFHSLQTYGSRRALLPISYKSHRVVIAETTCVPPVAAVFTLHLSWWNVILAFKQCNFFSLVSVALYRNTCYSWVVGSGGPSMWISTYILHDGNLFMDWFRFLVGFTTNECVSVHISTSLFRMHPKDIFEDCKSFPTFAFGIA